jgi:DNA helicase-2/ATP-dependent DNA helicase PcrA
MVYGRSEVAIPSRFLRDLPPDDLEWLQAGDPDAGDAWNGASRARPAAEFSDWGEGELVRHPKYGVGRVLWIQQGGNETRVAVRFPNSGQRTFVLEYAELERISVDEA